MKDYLWIIIVAIFALIAFIFFMMTLSNSSSLIKRLRKSKANIMLNLTILLIGLANIGIGIYLLQDVRQQIERFSNF
ncbi:MAG: hypothetical protein RR494_07100 [Vagococcus sp.]|uniref:hypothetical protein n=1 Tax=Vagococcus TaxID=2737 RepID=UPI002FCAA1EB